MAGGSPRAPGPDAASEGIGAAFLRFQGLAPPCRLPVPGLGIVDDLDQPLDRGPAHRLGNLPTLAQRSLHQPRVLRIAATISPLTPPEFHSGSASHRCLNTPPPRTLCRDLLAIHAVL